MHALPHTHSQQSSPRGPRGRRRPLTFGEEGGQADEHGGPMVPQRSHRRRAHPGDPERRPAAPRRRLGGEDTVAKSPEDRSGPGGRGSAGLGARAAAAPCVLLPPIHGLREATPRAAPELLSRVQRARRQTPPPFHPHQDIFTFIHANLFLAVYPERTGPQVAPKGRLRERGDAGRAAPGGLAGDGGAAGRRRPGRRRCGDLRPGGRAPGAARSARAHSPHPARPRPGARAGA